MLLIPCYYLLQLVAASLLRLLWRFLVPVLLATAIPQLLLHRLALPLLRCWRCGRAGVRARALLFLLENPDAHR